MVHYLISCRSLTYAQRAASAIERRGISAAVTRMPKGLSRGGCAYCVRVSQRRVTEALEALKKADVHYNKVYIVHQNGETAEVAL